MFMCDMPRGKSANNIKDLANDDKLKELENINKDIKLNIKKVEKEKILNDVEALRDNAKVFNALGVFLVRLFFGSRKFKSFTIYYIIVWILLYSAIVSLLFEFCKNGGFYISLINKIGLFLFICILGKFFKDNISILIKIFKNNKT